MSTLREIVTAVTSARDGSATLKYKKGVHATGEGDRYEERVLALVFLRCLKHGLIFQLSANNADAGKFDDVVLVWRAEGHPEAHILCVQLKHKKSATIHSATLLSEATNCDFGLRKYCTSYVDLSESLEMDTATFVLMTNACLGDSSVSMFEYQDVGNVPGLELLQAGGHLCKLNPNNQQVCQAVRENISFVEHFYLLCKQNDSDHIMSDICKELEELLDAGDECEPISDSLCKTIREWMNMRKGVCLSRSWNKWQAVVDEYIKKEVTKSRVVTTRLKYCNVADVWGYLESCKLAWVRPPERGTEALSATKIHQALCGQAHIMVNVQHFRQMRQRILRCWGPYCRWLVVIDDDTDGSCDILEELVAQIQTERNLVIVSSRETNSFSDTCKSCDVSDDSWNEFLHAKVRLNGARYECRLRDLMAGVDDLKALLDGQPALLLALARLSQPLTMGQQLETLPKYYVPRKLVDRWLVTDEFISSLGPRDVCITDSASYEAWRIRSLSGETDRIRGYKREKEIQPVEALDTARNVLIVEGRPGVGKSKMLSHVAEQIKERDSTCWVLRVNLLEFYRVLDNSDNGVGVVEAILKETIFNEDQLGRLEYALLCHSLHLSPNIVCLVDGFDEVCPDYANRCLEVLPQLTPRQGKLLVTTRPAVVRLLEARMGVLAHSLKPFSKSELEDFFTNHPSSGNIPAISGLNQSLRNLLRIPLFAEMFAKLSQENADTRDIVTLYEAFFRNNFRRFYEEKWGDNFSAPGKKREVEEAQKRHEEQLMLLAASVLLRRKAALAKLTFDKDYLLKSGIVYEFVNGKPAFLHRTFAEHFLAKRCFLSDGEKNCVAVYRKAYVNKRLEFFIESFDRRVARGRPLLEAVLDVDVDKVKELLDSGAKPRETDACGRNALHLAAAYDVQHPSSLLQLLCKFAEVGTLSAEDSLLGWTPMRYAAEGRCWAAVKVLLEEGGDCAQLGDFRVGRHEPEQLRAVYRQGGYHALWQHWVNSQRRKVKASSQGGVGIQIKFALSLISTNMPRKWLRVIAEKARRKGHKAVWSIILRGNTRNAEKEISLCRKVKKQKPKYGHQYLSRNPEAPKYTLGESSMFKPSDPLEVPEGGGPPQAAASPAGTSGRGPHVRLVDRDEAGTCSGYSARHAEVPDTLPIQVHHHLAADDVRARVHSGGCADEGAACLDSTPAGRCVLGHGVRLAGGGGGRGRVCVAWRRLDSPGIGRKRRRRGRRQLRLLLHPSPGGDWQHRGSAAPPIYTVATAGDDVTYYELLQLALATCNPFCT